MNNIKVIVLILAAAAIFSSFGYLDYLIYKPHVRIYRDILKKYESEVLKPHNIVVSSASYNNPWRGDGKLHGVEIDAMTIEDPNDIDKIRVIAVNIMESFRRYYYADERIQPYVKRDLITDRFFGFSLEFRVGHSIKGKEGTPPYLGMVLSGYDYNGQECYIHYNECTIKSGSGSPPEYYSYMRILDEPYEEALKIVKDSGQLTW